MEKHSFFLKIILLNSAFFHQKLTSISNFLTNMNAFPFYIVLIQNSKDWTKEVWSYKQPYFNQQIYHLSALKWLLLRQKYGENSQNGRRAAPFRNRDNILAWGPWKKGFTFFPFVLSCLYFFQLFTFLEHIRKRLWLVNMYLLPPHTHSFFKNI